MMNLNTSNKNNNSFYGLFSSYEYPNKIFRCVEKANNVSVYIEDVFLISRIYPKAFLYISIEVENKKIFKKLNKTNLSRVFSKLSKKQIRDIKLQTYHFKSGKDAIFLV